MSREKTLLKNTLIMALGTFLPRVINLLTTPIITGSLTDLNYGKVDLIQNTVLYFVVPLLTLQMEQSLFRFIIDSKDDEERKRVITNAYLVVALMALIGGLITLFVPISGFAGTAKFLIVGYIFAEIISITSRFVLRAFSKYKEYSILAGLVVIVNFICVSINLLGLHMDMAGVILALTIADLVGFVYVLKVCNIFKYMGASYYDSDYAKKLLAYALPFIPNQISWYINQMSDRWLISIFLGYASNGVYGMANKIPSIVNILYPAFNLAWTDSAQRSVGDEDSHDYYNRMFKMLFCIVSAGTALLLGFSPIIFKILNGNPQLSVALKYTPILIVATYFYCFAQFFGSIYVAFKETKNMSVTTTISAIINIVINLIFMNAFGVIIAVISTFCANIFLAGYRYYDLNKNHCRLKVSKRITILTLVMFIIMAYLSTYTSILFIAINVIISIIFAYFVAGDIFIDIIKKMINKRKKVETE